MFKVLQIIIPILSMNKVAILAAILALSAVSFVYLQSNQPGLSQFDQWKQNFGVSYDGSEEAYRRLIFEKNMEKIQRHNSDPSQTYKMALNQFAIFSEEQFKERFLGQIKIHHLSSEITVQQFTPSNIEIDWTTKSGVSRVKNQGSCGSCWAFAAVASCQSWALLSKKTADLSEQQLVDCSTSYGNHGCNGGSRHLALNYIKDHGITTETAYPYKGVTGTCQKQGGDFHISTVTEANGCTGIQNALQGRPIAVAVDAGGWSHYASGIFSNCGTSINHAVLLVGVVNGAWKIKNSWGTSWGQKGFIRLASGNTCGICSQPGVYPH